MLKDATGPIANLKDQHAMIDNLITTMITAMQSRDVSTALSIVNGDYNYTSSFTHDLTEKIEVLENEALASMVAKTQAKSNFQRLSRLSLFSLQLLSRDFTCSIQIVALQSHFI